jgi:hypothetical protein
MKLTPHEIQQLTKGADAPFLDDACELMTMKVVLMLKKKTKAMKAELEKLESGTPERNNLAQQINALNTFMVELSEVN